jgi:hypothetical protein
MGQQNFFALDEVVRSGTTFPLVSDIGRHLGIRRHCERDRTPLRRLEGRLRVVAGARLTLGNMRANGVRSLDVTTGDVSPPGGLGRSLCWSYSV